MIPTAIMPTKILVDSISKANMLTPTRFTAGMAMDATIQKTQETNNAINSGLSFLNKEIMSLLSPKASAESLAFG